MMRRALVLLGVGCATAAAVGCSSSTGAARSSGSSSTRSPAASSPTPEAAGGIRTVLSPLGLNIHSDSSTAASVVGVAAQGALLTVVDYKAGAGGWYKVQGQTVTGWIVADPTLTATGQYTSYQSARGFNVLYPADWTFAEEAEDTVFRPQQGTSESIVVRAAATTTALGQAGMPGYTSTFEDDALVVCGYTGNLIEYALGSGAATPAPPSGSTAMPLAMYAAIRLRFDASHAMQIAFNYSAQTQLRVFQDFYNSITFNFPQCEAPQSPAPSPT
jgi:uncharacterized protein YgiM (DUF1202 family)